jgi:hypothetical protein
MGKPKVRGALIVNVNAIENGTVPSKYLGIFLIGKEGNSRILGLEAWQVACACAWMEIPR